MTKHIIHVNRQNIAMNAKDGKERPVYTVKSKTHKHARYARSIKITGPCELVYNGTQQNCGARAWIETDSEIQLESEMSFKEARNIEGK